jgi:hypothetical protein
MGKDFSFPVRVQTGSWVSQLPIPWLQASCTVSKAARDVKLTSVSSAEVKIERNETSVPLTCLHAWTAKIYFIFLILFSTFPCHLFITFSARTFPSLLLGTTIQVDMSNKQP